MVARQITFSQNLINILGYHHVVHGRLGQSPRHRPFTFSAWVVLEQCGQEKPRDVVQCGNEKRQELLRITMCPVSTGTTHWIYHRATYTAIA